MDLCNRIINALGSAHEDAIIASPFLANQLQCEHKEILKSLKELEKIGDFIEVEAEEEYEWKEDNQEGVNVRRGKNFDQDLTVSSDLTDGVLQSNWSKCFLLPYNFDRMGIPVSGGKMNYVLNLLSLARDSLLEMGFQEALGHNHYISDNRCSQYDTEKIFFLQNSTSSLQTEEAVLRRMIKEICSFPAKMYSVGKVFKNIKDEIHEFHDMQMILADVDLPLSDLLGIIGHFCRKVQVGKVDFKPGYSPFTEPTLDITIYHGELDKWLIIGSAGIVRKEFLNDIVENKDLTYLHWKFSIELISLVKLEYTDMNKVLLTVV